MNFIRSMSLLLVLAFVSACASQDNQAETQYVKLAPLPGLIKDPGDSVMRDEINTFLSDMNAPKSSIYEFHRIDMDADGRRDALVLFNAPYGYWCGQYGCTMLIMRAYNDSFEIVNSIQPIRPPLYVSKQETNGWKDIITRVSGRTDKAKDVSIQYNGSKYPTDPASLPPDSTANIKKKTRVFNG